MGEMIFVGIEELELFYVANPPLKQGHAFQGREQEVIGRVVAALVKRKHVEKLFSAK